MRHIIFVLLLMPVLCRAQEPAASPASAPDWKTLFEQANAATKAWKERAQALEAEKNELSDRVNLLTAKLEDDPVRAAMDEKRQKYLLEQAQLQTANKVPVSGKVLSVGSGGVLLSCEKTPQAPDGLCFVVTKAANLMDGAQVLFSAVLMPKPYSYHSAGNSLRTVPCYRDSAH